MGRKPKAVVEYGSVLTAADKIKYRKLYDRIAWLYGDHHETVRKLERKLDAADCINTSIDSPCNMKTLVTLCEQIQKELLTNPPAKR